MSVQHCVQTNVSGSPTRTRPGTAGRTMLTSTAARRLRFEFQTFQQIPQIDMKSVNRARSMSPASSLPRTSRQSAPMLGLRSGMNRGRRLPCNFVFFLQDLSIYSLFSFRTPSPPTSNCDHAEQLEFRTKNYPSLQM